jgi:hypothetical protein
MKSLFYERLFILNRCLEQAAEVLAQFEHDKIIHPEFARHKRQSIENLRSDLSYVLTGMFHRSELEVCVGLAETQIKEDKTKL